MVAILAILFLLVPIAELAVIVQVASVVGIPETLFALVAVSVVGGWLVKREGLSVWQRTITQVNRGQLPHRELIDGFLILFAGALLLAPGFLTDLLALTLLFPPTRAAMRAVLLAFFGRRVKVMVAGHPVGRYRARGSGQMHDVTRVRDVSDRKLP